MMKRFLFARAFATLFCVGLFIGIEAHCLGQFFGEDELFISDFYTDDDRVEDGFFFFDEFTLETVSQLDPLDGSLASVEVNSTLDISWNVSLDTNGILSDNTHTASASGFFEVGIGVRNDRGGLSVFDSISVPWEVGCIGVPADGDGCQDSEGGGFSVDLGGILSDADISSLVGTGNSDDIVMFLARPTSSNFNLNNVGGAGVQLEVSVTGDGTSVDFTSNEGETPESALLPAPPRALPPEFQDRDCEDGFCIPFRVGNGGAGIDRPVFFDPPVAVGYDYEVVTGPNIAGVEIPAGFGEIFDLHVSTDGGQNYTLFGQIRAEELIDLTGVFTDGVTHMRLTGIAPDLAVDPDDPLSFPTGLTFVSAGEVGIVMTPITINAVPEPSTAVLLLGSIGLLIARRRRMVA